VGHRSLGHGSRNVKRGGGGIVTAVALAALGVLTVPAMSGEALAFVYTDIIDFHVNESTRTYGTYSISSIGNNTAYYRWVDDPDHTTVISGNSCADLALYGKNTIPAHDNRYYGLFRGSPYQCFALRGRTAFGAGAMYNHDGRLAR